MNEDTCVTCNGNREITCSACEEIGTKSQTQNDERGTAYNSWSSCANCNGRGTRTCPRCNGTGKR